MKRSHTIANTPAAGRAAGYRVMCAAMALACLLIAAPAAAQPRTGTQQNAGTQRNTQALQQQFVNAHSDFFRLYLSEGADLKARYRFEPKGEEDGGPGSYELHLFGIEGELPVALNKDSFLRVGGLYDHRRYRFDSVRGAAVAPSSLTLHRLMATVGVGTFLNNDFLLSAALRPGLFSDLSGGLDENDFDLQGEGLLVYRLNPGAQLVFGVERSRAFDQTILPLAGIRLLSEDGTIHISLTAPKELRIGYALSPKLELYTGAWAYGDEFRVEEDGREFDLKLMERRIGVGATWYPLRQFSLTLEGGTLFDSSLEFHTGNPGQFRGDLEPSPYFALQIGLSL